MRVGCRRGRREGVLRTKPGPCAHAWSPHRLGSPPRTGSWLKVPWDGHKGPEPVGPWWPQHLDLVSLLSPALPRPVLVPILPVHTLSAFGPLPCPCLPLSSPFYLSSLLSRPLSLCFCLCLSLCPSLSVSPCLSVCLCLCPPLSLSLSLSLSLYLSLSMSLFVSLCLLLSLCLSLSLSGFLSLSVHLSLSTCVSSCLKLVSRGKAPLFHTLRALLPERSTLHSHQLKNRRGNFSFRRAPG